MKQRTSSRLLGSMNDALESEPKPADNCAGGHGRLVAIS